MGDFVEASMPEVLIASQKQGRVQAIAAASQEKPWSVSMEHRKGTSSKHHEQVALNFLLLAGRGSRISSKCGAGRERGREEIP